MPDFCPDGYVSTRDAIARAARHWFAERLEGLEEAVASQSRTSPKTPIEQAVQAFSWPHISEDWRGIASETVHRLRNQLHQGELTAHYFDNYGRHTLPREFWAATQADGVLESGLYWPFGEPSSVLERRPNYPLFLREMELRRLLTDQPEEKRQLPRSRLPDLADALRRLGHLPDRNAQLQALRELPEFREFKITFADFREAARRLPRNPGRKSQRKS
jgi:hypothetical protein